MFGYQHLLAVSIDTPPNKVMERKTFLLMSSLQNVQHVGFQILQSQQFLIFPHSEDKPIHFECFYNQKLDENHSRLP